MLNINITFYLGNFIYLVISLKSLSVTGPRGLEPGLWARDGGTVRSVVASDIKE